MTVLVVFSYVLGGNTDCGATLTEPTDIIVSPDQTGNGKYDNFVDCLWTIQLQDDLVIVFHITEMDIQMVTSACKFDVLEVSRTLML